MSRERITVLLFKLVHMVSQILNTGKIVQKHKEEYAL